MKYVFLLFVILASFFYLFSSSSIWAANPKNTITVLPQLTKIDLASNKPEAEIFYTNNSSTPVELGLSVQDVQELEDRSPVGILDPKEAANYKYSLSSWVTLNRQALILNPGETQSVNITVNRDKLAPGGHYGSILAEIRQPDNQKAVRIKGVLASLLFVRAATGNEIETARITFFGPTDQNIFLPSQYLFRFQNSGNVDLTPYGTVEIKDSANRVVAKGIVNEDSLITLPEAIRTYRVRTTPLKTVILPGRYTAVLNIHFGKGNNRITSKSTLLTFGNSTAMQIELGILAILLILTSGALFVLKKRFVHKRKQAT